MLQPCRFHVVACGGKLAWPRGCVAGVSEAVHIRENGAVFEGCIRIPAHRTRAVTIQCHEEMCLGTDAECMRKEQ